MPKKSYKTYRLYFKAPLHIGDIRPNDYTNSERFIRSDTFIAAISAMLGKLGKLEDKWNGFLPFRVSSLFPFTKEEDKVIYFFPKLSKALPLEENNAPITYVKKLKKIQWLDSSYFEKQLNQIPIKYFGDEEQKDLQKEFCSGYTLSEFMTTQISQRVSIPRVRNAPKAQAAEEEDITGEPTPFYVERLFFREDSGLYFIAEGEDFGLLEEGLTLLQHEGLGTDRTVGNGSFEWELDSITINLPESEYCTNLSLFCPETKKQLTKMLAAEASYDIIKRGGWITTGSYQSLRKKAIYMFTEGSIFSGDDTPKGRAAVDITPDLPLKHNIYRNGNSIFLPVKL